MEKFDLIVIGCGGIGSAAMYAATQVGLKTLCLEQFERGHHKGGTHGESRMFRTLYYGAPNYIPLLKQAYSGWKTLEKKANKKLYEENGVLEVVSSNDERLAKAVATAEKYHLPIEVFSAKEIQDRFSGFYIPDHLMGFFQPQSGYLYVDECLNYFIDASLSAGAKALFNEQVLSWKVNGDNSILVKTQNQAYQCRYLIITTGCWTADLLPELVIPLKIFQKKFVWFEVEKNAYSLQDKAPCYAFHLSNGTFFGFPNISNYIKVARDTGGALLKNPAESSKTINHEELNSIKSFSKQYLTKITLADVKDSNCLYDMSPDSHFILSNHPDFPQIAFAAGLSGHAYKMSNVIGEILVDLVTINSTVYDLSFLSLKRFSQ